MCGIVGIYSKSGSLRPSTLAPALDRLKHRGPDDEGCLLFDAQNRKATVFGGDDTPSELGLRHWREAADASGHVLIGHRRLSILDLSPRGHQPMASSDGTCWIVFNGEIYNYIELRDELRALGHEFHTGTDTEVILHAWQQWGRDCLPRFNGDWAFCILDTRGDEPFLFLARDRYGIKPLFFADTPEGFWFASEAKALVGPAVPFKPRESAVVPFLFGGELPPSNGSETFFENINQLPPGEAMTLCKDGIERLLWYDLKAVTQNLKRQSAAEAVKAMAGQVDEAVRVRLRADVPVGSCLSGGVDSSSIVGTMRSLLQKDCGSGELHTFSAIYKETGTFNEVDWIKQVVAHNKTRPHYVLPDDVPLAEQFDRMVWHQDEPFQTASIFAQWCVMQKARKEGVTVLLDGQAADELFGGYQPGSYQEQFLEWLQRGQYGLLLKEWIARKFATRHSWFAVLREFYQMLVHGPTGLLWVDPKRFFPRPVFSTSALRKEYIDLYYPQTQPPYDPAKVAAELEATRAKLAEHEEKLTRWLTRLRSLKKDKDQQERGELAARIAEKRTQIASSKRKLYWYRFRQAELRRFDQDQTGTPAARWRKLPKDLERAWNRLHGEPLHQLREYLLKQTLVTSLPVLLRFEDRNSMAFSVEARVPFTDHRLVEWAFTEANDFKIHKGWAKWVLREAMKGRAPASVLWRRDKTGFETPDITMTRRLIQHRERHPAQSDFLSRYLDTDLVKAACQRLETPAATREDGRQVWRWLVADSWHEQFKKAGGEFAHRDAETPQATAKDTAPHGSTRPGTPTAAPADEPRTRVCILVFGNAAGDARVQREARALARKHDVTVAGFGGNPFVDGGRHIHWFELCIDDPRRRLISPVKQWLRLRLARFFPRLLESYMLEFAHFRHAWHLVQASHFDVVYCNDVDTLLVGNAARRHNPRTKVILDLHEHPTREMDSGSLRESKHWRTTRKPLVTGIMQNFARHADGTLTVVDSFAPLFVEEFGMKEPVVIHNAPALVPLPPRATSSGGDKVRLIHHGACSPSRKLELMIQMMAWLDDRFTLDFMLLGNDPAYLDLLRREAAKLRPGRVNFLAPVAPDEIVKTIAGYDIGVFLLPPVIFNFEHALPNKFFDFIGAGLAVAIGPTAPMARITRKHEIGWVSEDFDPKTLAKLLNSLSAEDIARKQEASLQLRQTLNAETEMSRLVDFVDALLAAPVEQGDK